MEKKRERICWYEVERKRYEIRQGEEKLPLRREEDSGSERRMLSSEERGGADYVRTCQSLRRRRDPAGRVGKRLFSVGYVI